jgi:predicted nucleotidyltransferase
MTTPKKHLRALKTKSKELEQDPEVIGFYLIGSLAKENATEQSDIDLEVVYRTRAKGYELKDEILEGIKIGVGKYSLAEFENDFSHKLETTFCALNSKILHDPKGIIKKNLEKAQLYFKKNPRVKEFWEKNEKEYRDAKNKGEKRLTYFEVVEELEQKIDSLVN